MTANSFSDPMTAEKHTDPDQVVPLVGTEISPPSFLGSAISHYCKTRVTELFPTKEYLAQHTDLLNPFPAVAEISGKQWLFILSGLAAWTWDAFDFFTVSLNVKQLSLDLDRKVSDITWAITLVLMLRTVGAFLFGYFGDKYGAKWPLVVNLLLMVVIQIGVSFITTFRQFLALRSLFGIVMGGIYGNATSTACT